MIKLSIIYIYYQTPEEIVNSIKSLSIRNFSYEIIVVDNNSPIPLPLILKQNSKIKIIKNKKNLGFGKAVNQAVRKSLGEIIFILNPDTLVIDNSISLMVRKLEQDKSIGVLGPQIKNAKGKILPSIGAVPKLPDVLFALSFINKLWPKNPYSKKYWTLDVNRNIEQESDTVGGAAMMIPKYIFIKAGGFDERFFLYFEEIDLCLRIKKLGYKILFFPQAKIIHFVGKSTNDKKFINKQYEKSRFLYLEKNYGFIPAFLTESFLRSSSFLGKIF